MAAKMTKNISPPAVVVSMPSCRDRNSTPRTLRSSTTRTRCCTERPSRSMRVDHEDVAFVVAEVVERGREAGSGVELAGGVVGEDPTGAGGGELVHLRVEDLVECGHSGVANDGHQRSYPSRRGPVFCPEGRPLGP